MQKDKNENISRQMKEKIEQVLEIEVRPILLKHEGNVELIEYEEEKGILKVKLTGHCAGCPSAQLTTEEVIAEKVKHQISEIKQVLLVNEVSEELFSMAKELLLERHGRKKG